MAILPTTMQGVKAATPVGNVMGRSSPANASAPNVGSAQNKNTKARKKEEENLQKIFAQVDKPKDEFTIWCTSALSSMDSEVGEVVLRRSSLFVRLYGRGIDFFR